MTTPPTSRTQAGYEISRQTVEAVDGWSREMDRKWGPGRLEAVCPDPGLRQRFQSQREKFNRAVWEEDDVRGLEAHGLGMIYGYQALDQAATAAGIAPLDHSAVVEGRRADGVVIAIVPSNADYPRAIQAGRAVEVWTIDQVIELIERSLSKDATATIAAAAKAFGGVKVESIEFKNEELDDEIPF